MEQYINKDAIVTEIETMKSAAEVMLTGKTDLSYWKAQKHLCEKLLSFLDTLETKDPYEQCIQHSSIKDGIKAHAETYSFNIESELFNQLTKEQQELWRKEIEQACISGGEAGVELAKDSRYKENLETKEVDLDLEITLWANAIPEIRLDDVEKLARYFFELGLKTQKKELKEYKQPEYSYLETVYRCGKKPRWNIGDILAYYEFYSDREGECVLGKITKVDFDEEQCDWFYTFEDGGVCNEQTLLEEETYKKN